MGLDDIRDEIDRLDAEIVKLLNERAARAVEIGDKKTQQGLPVRDPEREALILARVRELNEGPLRDPMLEQVYRQIIAACLDLETNR